MKKLLSTALVALVTLIGAQASAANYTLWIHGRSGATSTTPANYNDWRYWGPSTTAAGVNKRAVNWNGTQRIANENFRVRDALDCFCTGTNWCYISTHSAGNLQIGYALALFGGSARLKKNGIPNSAGVCGNTDGTSQTGWNIRWVNVASGAGGGSELANSGDWAISEPLVTDLVTTNARALYNHNTTRGVSFRMFAGSRGTFYAALLPGQDDEAVSYHSTGGVSATGAFCNPGDLFCNGVLNTGTAATSNGVAKWSFHTVLLRDDTEAFNHYTNGNWGGIVGPVRTNTVTNAL
jgi:hypothetical protein